MPGGSPWGNNNSLVLAGSGSDSNQDRHNVFTHIFNRESSSLQIGNQNMILYDTKGNRIYIGDNRMYMYPTLENQIRRVFYFDSEGNRVYVNAGNRVSYNDHLYDGNNIIDWGIRVHKILNSFFMPLGNGFKIPVLTGITEITKNTVGLIPLNPSGFFSALNNPLLFTQPLSYISYANGITEYVELGLQYKFLPINPSDVYICEVTLPNGYSLIFRDFFDFYNFYRNHKGVMLGGSSHYYCFDGVAVENVTWFIKSNIMGKIPAPYIIRCYSNYL